jgi:hypothetical protein
VNFPNTQAQESLLLTIITKPCGKINYPENINSTNLFKQQIMDTSVTKQHRTESDALLIKYCKGEHGIKAQ